MARKARHKAGRVTGPHFTLVAVDPGEVHTGVASIEVRGIYSIWRTGLVETTDDYLKPVSDVEWILRSSNKPTLALEDYRIRPVGHQRFARGITLRLIGAIEYLARLSKTPTYFYQPGNIKGDLDRFRLTPILERWSKDWPSASSNWEHARSAWRILGHLILNEAPELEYLLDPYNMPITHFLPFPVKQWPTEDWGGSWATPMFLKHTHDDD